MTTTIGEAADRLNAAIARAEQVIAGLGLGSGATCELPGLGVLGFKKINGTGHLYFAGSDGGTVLLATTSLRVRVAAAPHLGALVKAMQMEHAKLLGEVEAAHDAVARFVAEMTEQPAPEAAP